MTESVEQKQKIPMWVIIVGVVGLIIVCVVCLVPVLLLLLGPAIGDVFSQIVEDLDSFVLPTIYQVGLLRDLIPFA